MKKSSLFWLLVLSVVLSGCGGDGQFAPLASTAGGINTGNGSGSGTVPVKPPALTATFQNIRNNILVPKCIGCHTGNSPPAGFGYSTYEETVRSVIPGNPTLSILLASVKDGSMPRGSQPLTPSEITSIEVWILLGAKND